MVIISIIEIIRVITWQMKCEYNDALTMIEIRIYFLTSRQCRSYATYREIFTR